PRLVALEHCSGEHVLDGHGSGLREEGAGETTVAQLIAEKLARGRPQRSFLRNSACPRHGVGVCHERRPDPPLSVAVSLPAAIAEMPPAVEPATVAPVPRAVPPIGVRGP